jgi:hypothetical protein
MLKWWMRIVGIFYLLQFVVMAILRIPIKTLAPDALTSADTVAKFLVDTWILFGVEVGVIGLGLLLASRMAAQAKALVWTVIGIEFFKGPVCDIYMIMQGYEPATFIIWIVIHTIIIVTGILALKHSAVPR